MTQERSPTPAKTVRLTSEEDRVLKQAADLLVYRLTSSFRLASSRRLIARLLRRVTKCRSRTSGPGPILPDRGEESTSRRTTFTFEQQTLDLLERAATYVESGETFFIVGSTFRYLANLRTVDKRLTKLKLPTKFDRVRDPVAKPDRTPGRERGGPTCSRRPEESLAFQSA